MATDYNLDIKNIPLFNMHVVHKLLLNDVDYISYITKPIVISPPMDLRSTAMCVCVSVCLCSCARYRISKKLHV